MYKQILIFMNVILSTTGLPSVKGINFCIQSINIIPAVHTTFVDSSGLTALMNFSKSAKN